MSSNVDRSGQSVAAVLEEFRKLATEIDGLDQSAAERFGVNRTDLRALELLGVTGEIAPTVLASALGFTTGGVTTVIDRLERAGYAIRRADSHDRRKVVVEATALLQAREGEIFGELLRATKELIESYSDAELTTIGDFLARARLVMAAHVDPTPRAE